MLLACNHPNSFLDAIIVGSHFDSPVHFLARGDAFRRPAVRKILALLKVIPIYRLTEGREYLALNNATFEACRDILLQKGIILIFSEGLCENKWMLRPLKKGTARIALDAWTNPSIDEEFRVMPVSLNYNSYRGLGKRVVIHFGQKIEKEEISYAGAEGERINQFNDILSERLTEGVLQSEKSVDLVQTLISNHSAISTNRLTLVQDLQQKQRVLVQSGLLSSLSKLKKPGLIITSTTSFILNVFAVIILLPFGVAGFILHAPLYLPLKTYVANKTKGTVFYDSVLFGSLMLLYPGYWLIINIVSFLFVSNFTTRFIFLTMPMAAYLFLLCREGVERVGNHLVLSHNERKAVAKLIS